MRIWRGKEQEGKDIGKQTIFIESSELKNPIALHDIIDKENIKRLYFGAGKVDIKIVDSHFFQYFLGKGYEVIVETSYQNLCIPNFLKEKLTEVIIRLDTDSVVNVSFKRDNNKEVVLYYPKIKTTLESVKNGLYTNNDEVIWEG